ncbi:MAG: Holliday junction resolvase RuvX [Actinomycetota bacterium]
MVTSSVGRILSLDPGSVRIGVAVSDRKRTMAFPRSFIAVDGHELDALSDLIAEEEATMVVIGLPRSLSGSEGAAAKTATALASRLAEHLPSLEILMVDERFTTVTASGMLQGNGVSQRQQRGKIDSAAAAVLLQTYLDRNRQ